MSWVAPWFLLLALAPVVVVFWLRSRGRRGFGVWSKAASIALIGLALAQPVLETNEDRQGLVVLADVSASLSPEDINRVDETLRNTLGSRRRNIVRIIPFARQPLPALEEESASLAAVRASTTKFRELQGGTNLEAAMQAALSAVPQGFVPRILLLSDGHENEGSVVRALWQAKQRNIPVDVIPLAGRPKPQLRISDVSLPVEAFAGEKFVIDMQIETPANVPAGGTPATVEVDAEGKVLGTQQVALQPGVNRLKMTASLTTSGAIDLTGVVKTGSYGEARFARSLSVRAPRLLYVSEDPPGTERDFLDALRTGKFDVQSAAQVNPATLDDFQVVVLNNLDYEGLPVPVKESLERYVRNGGGLLVIGGEKNNYRENKTQEDILERALPAKLAPPRSPEGTCVILIVDKSSSMEGRKMELARIAAIGVADNVRPVDFIGVLIFDNSFQWAVPIRKAEDRTLIKRLIAGITPDGGTQIAPALTEAYKKTVPVKATFKHIVLLTDGISEEGDSIALAKDAANNNITISTVGLGQDVNRAYLEKVAAFAKGKSYFLIDPSGLEQILLKDVMEFTGSTAIEKPLVPRVEKDVEILREVGMNTAPALKGYTKFITKPAAETILSMDTRDPLLARWQYGLGRSMVFTSDAKSRWAEDWVKWPGFDKLWLNIVRDLLPHAQSAESTLTFDQAKGDLVGKYRLADGWSAPDKAPEIFALGPSGFQQPTTLRKTGNREYEARVHIGSRRGLFRVRPLQETRLFPEIGLYREEAEYNEFSRNEALLRQIASFTGGRYDVAQAQVWRSGAALAPTRTELWPGLLGLSILVSLLELVFRKWPGATRTVLGWFGR